MERVPINSCRFVGQLYNFNSSVVSGHILGKGELRLVDSQSGQAFQTIKLMAWYDKAEELASLESGTWIHVLTSYSPSYFAGNLQDQFVVAEFLVI